MTLWHPPKDCSSLYHTLHWLLAVPSLCSNQQTYKAVLVWLITVLILWEGKLTTEWGDKEKGASPRSDEVQFLVGAKVEIYSGFLLSWISPTSRSSGRVWVWGFEYIWVLILLFYGCNNTVSKNSRKILARKIQKSYPDTWCSCGWKLGLH